MSHNLYNIMVPVNFTASDKWAVAKAVELANAFNCNIHLVHVVSFVAFYSGHGILTSEPLLEAKMAKEKLKEMNEEYKSHLCSGGKIIISLLHGNPAHELTDYIVKNNADIVVTGLSRFNLLHRLWSAVSVTALMHKTNVPVLAVRASGLVSHFKKIVLPVNDHIPLRRIRMAAMLGRYFKSTVYLVSLKQKEGEPSLPVLNQTLEIFQSLTTVPVQSILLEGRNLAEMTLRFSKKINADLIMISPLKEFFMPGWWARVTRQLMSYVSSIPVLSVAHGED